MTSPMLRACAEVITPQQADKAVNRLRGELARAQKNGAFPQAMARIIARLRRAEELQRMVRARTGTRPPTPERYERPRVDAEVQRAAIEAARTAAPLAEFPRALIGTPPPSPPPPPPPSPSPPSEALAQAPAEPPRCRVHPSQPAGTCALCLMDPVRQWRRQHDEREREIEFPLRYGSDDPWL